MLLLLFLFSITEGTNSIQSDSTKVQKNAKSLWEKVSFGVGYSPGICWTGEDLATPSEPSPIGGIEQIPEYLFTHLYWLNSVELSATYPMNKKWGVEIGGGYGWAALKERETHLRGAWENLNWKIKPISIEIKMFYKVRKNWKLGYGLSYIFLTAKDRERHFVFNDSTGGWFYDRKIDVAVNGNAVGLNFTLLNISKLNPYFSRYFSISPRFIVGKESKNNLTADLEDKWKGKTHFNFSGISVSFGIYFSTFKRGGK